MQKYAYPVLIQIDFQFPIRNALEAWGTTQKI